MYTSNIILDNTQLSPRRLPAQVVLTEAAKTPARSPNNNANNANNDNNNNSNSNNHILS